ncbi:MAG: SO_0444 family Cu/Zn efflux transporter [Desulfobulbaceae bacterium]
MDIFLSTLLSFVVASWEMLLDASVYILFGIGVGGLLKMFLSTEYVAHHLGRGRFASVVKAALFGIPIPLCSCGVLPAAASLKKQGANNGATTAFLISTPESGVDSIAISYALLDPILTVARPVAAFLTAMVAGFAENLVNPPGSAAAANGSISCPVDNCCDGTDCAPEDHRNHHTFLEKMRAGMRYAIGELWGDLAGWFFVGILLAGVITTLLPDRLFASWLGGGIDSMLLMLVIGIPLYICATASTPVAAAFLLKGASPGTALVFLLVGPATNVTSLSVLVGLLGKRATSLYLVSIALVSVACGLALDFLYLRLGITASAVIGQAAEIVPEWLRLGATLFLIAISVRPLYRSLRKLAGRFGLGKTGPSCGCGADCGSGDPAGLHQLPLHDHHGDQSCCGR